MKSAFLYNQEKNGITKVLIIEKGKSFCKTQTTDDKLAWLVFFCTQKGEKEE